MPLAVQRATSRDHGIPLRPFVSKTPLDGGRRSRAGPCSMRSIWSGEECADPRAEEMADRRGGLGLTTMLRCGLPPLRVALSRSCSRGVLCELWKADKDQNGCVLCRWAKV